jgi:hypothetical protein
MVFTAKVKRSLLPREIIAVCSENDMKRMIALWEETRHF